MHSSRLKGFNNFPCLCAETLDDPYYYKVPLPRIPGYHKLDKQTRLADVHDRRVASNMYGARMTRESCLIDIQNGTNKLLCTITGTSQFKSIAHKFYLAPSLYIVAKTL